MTLRQLQIFSAIVETGRFTAAARKLYLAQPSVSQQIHALEDELGDRLFVRLKNRQVELTQAGKILKQHSDLVLRQCELARMEISALSREPSGQIRVGIGGHQLTSMLPPAVSAFHSVFPKVSVDIVNSTTPQIVELLRGNGLDLGVVNFPIQVPELRTRFLFTEELLVVVQAKHPLARKRMIESRDLAALPLVLYDHSTSTRRRLEEYFRSIEISPAVVVELSSVEAMKSMVAGGLGATIIPASAMLDGAENRHLRGLQIRGRPLTRSVGMAMRQLPQLPSVMDTMADFIRIRFDEIKARLPA